MAVRTPPSHPSATDIPSFVPAPSTSIATAHWLISILGEIQECVNETIPLDISADPQSGVINLMETVRWRFEEALTSVWLRGVSEVIVIYVTVQIDDNRCKPFIQP